MAGDGLFMRLRSAGTSQGQRLGVNLLFGALLVVVVGSLAGEWLGMQQKLGENWFWFGSQGMSMWTSVASGRYCCLAGCCSGCG